MAFDAETYAATGQFFFTSSLCCAKRCKAYSSLCCTCTVHLQEPVLHLDVSMYKSFCAAPGRDVSAYKSFELYWTCLSTKPVVAPVRVCLQALCDAPGRVCLQEPVAAPVHVCLQELCDAPGHVCLQESSPCCTCRCALLRCIFRFVSVCFETCMFVSVVSIHVRNTETNRKNIFLVSWNKPKHNRNRLSFGSFRFKPKIFFVCFEDTLPRIAKYF